MKKKSASSKKVNSKKSLDELSEGWEWVSEIIDEAHLPHLGLPVRWEKTKEKHTKIAFEPKTKKTIDIISKKETLHKVSPVGFISATKGKHMMPGTEEPASVRY